MTKLNILLGLIVLPALLSTASATTRKVLFIGNSYTYTNNMPLILKNIAAAQGDTLMYDESDPGGYTFSQHCTYPATISKIFSQPWDIVVLQEQSQLPSFPPAEVDTEVYPYAHILDSMIAANDTCTQTMFLMTWGHANGDPLNCASYPVICTYAGMQARLRQSYLQMTQNNNAIVAPVGVAWKVLLDSFTSIWPYSADSSHPVVAGSYLEACVLYSSIFHKRTSGNTYTDGLASSVANTLQRLSDRVVFDSLMQWQQYGHYPYAGFNTSITSNTLAATSTPTVPATDLWVFGDGATGSGGSPTHTYSGAGTYVISHTVTTDCFTETTTDTIHIGSISAAIAISSPGSEHLGIRQLGNGVVVLVPPYPAVIEIYDMTGRCIRRYHADNAEIKDNFTPGFYCYRLYSDDAVSQGNMAVY